MQHNTTPLWKEIPDKFSEALYNSYNWEKYELIFFKNDYSVLYYGKHYKLIAQEYKFLQRILNKNNKKIDANKLMEEISSKCKIELRQKLSYRIKSKIKNKLKKGWEEYLPSYKQVEWMILDNSYEHNECRTVDANSKKHYGFQYCDFETAFSMLISVKNGYFYTSFRKK